MSAETTEPSEWCKYCGGRCYPAKLTVQHEDGGESPRVIYLHCCMQCAKYLRDVLAQAPLTQEKAW